MHKGILVVGLLLVMGISMVSADDDTTPKPGTAADNECYPGGVLYREENQDGCPTLWYWKAGWFLARFNRGLISRADFPKEFESVLPPAGTEGICWTKYETYTDPFSSVLYIGPPNQKGNAQWHAWNPYCEGDIFINPDGYEFIVFADNEDEAYALCAAQGRVFILARMNDYGWNAPADAYGCHVF